MKEIVTESDRCPGLFSNQSLADAISELDQKQSWIKKGFDDLLFHINQEFESYFKNKPLMIIDEVFEFSIAKRINQYSLERMYSLNLEFQAHSVVLVLMYGKEDSFGDIDWIYEKNPSIPIIRKIIKKLPSALKEFSLQISSISKEDEEIKLALSNYLSQVTSNVIEVNS